jgi:hypothetical protein
MAHPEEVPLRASSLLWLLADTPRGQGHAACLAQRLAGVCEQQQDGSSMHGCAAPHPCSVLSFAGGALCSLNGLHGLRQGDGQQRPAGSCPISLAALITSSSCSRASGPARNQSFANIA